jgi:hypothetical protein
MPETPTLSVLETGQKELTVMRSLLKLAGVSGKGGNWQVIDQAGGDVTIVDVDSDAGEARWLDLREAGHAPVALTRRREFAGTHVLHKPVRSREFLDLLERLTSNEADIEPAEVHAGVPRGADGAPQWQGLELPEDPDRATLAEHLRRQTWSGPVVLEASGWPRLIIDPGSGSWYYDGSISDMTPRMFSQALSASAGRPVSSSDLVEAVEGVVRRPLSELKWFAGLAQARGRLHPDLLGDVRFMLTQAPGEAMKHERFAYLARILIRAPVGVDDLHARSGEAPENIAAFLNACYTTGRLLVSRSAQASGF